MDDPEAAEDLDLPVIQAERDEKLMFFEWNAQKLAGGQVQVEPIRRPVKLELSYGK
jgi:hypothetical protein